MKNLEDIYLKNKAFEKIIIEIVSFTNNFFNVSVVKFYHILKGGKKKLKFDVHVSFIIRWQNYILQMQGVPSKYKKVISLVYLLAFG
jgi:hypothetical protein